MIQYPQQKPRQSDPLSLLTYVSVAVAALAVLYLLWVRWLHNIINDAGFAPHGYCFLWNPGLVWLHAGSDAFIGIAYVLISATLVYFVSKARRELPFHWVFIAFGMFIIACGFTHFLDVWTLWNATYWLSGTVKLITAVVSMLTAIVLPFLVPKAQLLIEEAKVSRLRKLELEEAHRELEIAYERIKELDQVKTDFFANISHELRTPLTLILGSVMKQPGERRGTDTDIIERNARTLLNYVNDLLDIAKLEAGRMELCYTHCDAVALLKRCLSLFSNAIQERRIALTLDVPEALAIEVDAEKLQRVFLNLVSNALKFTPVEGKIHCRLHSDGQWMHFTIQDSGPGIPAELREVIFERFRQSDSNLRHQIKGTGLGLAIVKELIELHNGRVWINESPFGGASFTIELPVRAPAGAPLRADTHHLENLENTAYKSLVPVDTTEEFTSEEEAAHQANTSYPLVLVIEDNAEMARLVARTLNGSYRVVTARNGQDGLEKVVALKPDLILCDIMMPVMSGAQFVERLRANPDFDGTPIIILSARADDALRVKLLREGVQDYVVKPFSPEEVSVRVSNLIAMKQARQILQQELSERSEDIVTLAEEIAARKRELQEMLEKLRKNEEHLQQVNKMQNNFIAIVSHEFRTTLTGIQGFSELLRDQEFTAEEIKEYATDINVDAKRLTRMIDELLDLERMKSGKMALYPKLLDVNALLNDIAQRKQATLTEHHIELWLDESLPKLMVDPDKLTQVVTNLLSNAVKYSPGGGVIRIESRHEGQVAHISIQDQGIGIPANALDTIFETYSRVEGEATHYIRGTGLGLPIVRQIVQMHGGKVWAESTLGEGSTFHFTIPLTTKRA